MDNNLDQLDVFSNQQLNVADTASTLSRGMEISIRHIKKLNHTIEPQREIISEQAAKVKKLEEMLKKYGWST